GPGIGTIARNVYGEGIAKWSGDLSTSFKAGIFKVPFGSEIPESSSNRFFIERSWGILNLFSAERDIGVWARTTALEKKLTIDLAVVNGQLLGERFFVTQPDLNRGKDVMGRLEWDFG